MSLLMPAALAMAITAGIGSVVGPSVKESRRSYFDRAAERLRSSLPTVRGTPAGIDHAPSMDPAFNAGRRQFRNRFCREGRACRRCRRWRDCSRPSRPVRPSRRRRATILSKAPTAEMSQECAPVISIRMFPAVSSTWKSRLAKLGVYAASRSAGFDRIAASH